jgi:hypothetical protein
MIQPMRRLSPVASGRVLAKLPVPPLRLALLSSISNYNEARIEARIEEKFYAQVDDRYRFAGIGRCSDGLQEQTE